MKVKIGAAPATHLEKSLWVALMLTSIGDNTAASTAVKRDKCLRRNLYSTLSSD